MYIHAIQAFSGWKQQALAFFFGILTALSLPPIHFFAVCFLTFPLLVWLLDGVYEKCVMMHRNRKCYGLAALIGWDFGFGYFSAGLWWLGSAMLVDVSSYGWAIPFAMLGLPAFLAFFYALATCVAFIIWQCGYGRIVVLSCAFGLAEWLRGHIFTGFPWNAIGYTAMPFPLLMQPAAILGIYGMNVLAVLVYATPALLNEQRDRKTGMAIALILITIDISFGLARLYNSSAKETKTNETIRVRLIQTVIPQDAKIDHVTWQEYFERQLLYLSLATPLKGEALPQLIIWPESSVPYVLAHAPGTLMRIGNILKDGQLVLIGTIRAEENKSDKGHYQYFNSLQVIDPDSRIVASADKVRLVPFGEYFPFAAFFRQFGLKAFAETAGGYSAGAEHAIIPLANGLVILPLICYEAIFPIEFDYEGFNPDVLVNITNDAWFGNTPGPWQHFAQARIRAVEQEIPLIRVANHGISAVVDSYGRVSMMLRYNESGFADIDLPKQSFFKNKTNRKNIYFYYILTIFFLYSIVLKFSHEY